MMGWAQTAGERAVSRVRSNVHRQLTVSILRVDTEWFRLRLTRPPWPAAIVDRKLTGSGVPVLGNARVLVLRRAKVTGPTVVHKSFPGFFFRRRPARSYTCLTGPGSSRLL